MNTFIFVARFMQITNLEHSDLRTVCSLSQNYYVEVKCLIDVARRQFASMKFSVYILLILGMK